MNWHFTNNQFLSATARNYKKAYLLSLYHDAALDRMLQDNPGDPDFTMLYNRYHPAHQSYVKAYTQWDSAGGNQQSNTLNVQLLLQQMTGLLDDWELVVLMVYKKKTPGYKKLFPNNRKPFRTGNIDSRINALNTLAENIGDDPALAALKADITRFYKDISTARYQQDGSKSVKDNRSSDVDSARITAMQLQYADTGYLINKYYETPEKVNAFFELEQLRVQEQTVYTGKIKPDAIENIFTRTLSPDNELRLHSRSADGYIAYLSNIAGTAYGNGIAVKPGEERIATAADFDVPNLHNFRFLNVQNMGKQPSEFEIVIE